MSVYEFIIILLLLLLCNALAFLTGFGVGDFKACDDIEKLPNNPEKKEKRPQESDPNPRIDEINRIIANIDKYDGSFNEFSNKGGGK